MAKKTAKKAGPATPAADPEDLAAGLRVVEIAGEPLRLFWVDPASLNENDLNFKVHTDFQSEVVSEMIARHGWIKPLVYNRTTKRLLDGHDRRKIAIAEGYGAVPVVIGEWPAEQEPEIIATLDPSGSLARTDPEALHRVMQRMPDPAPAIRKLMENLAESEGVLRMLAARQPRATPPAFQADPEPRADDGAPPERGESPYGQSGDDEYRPPSQAPAPSHVRMVQLFLDTKTFPEFQAMVIDLGEEHGTSTTTETVMAVLRAAYADAFGREPAASEAG